MLKNFVNIPIGLAIAASLPIRPREAPAKFFPVFMNQYYCKNYILMTFYHSLSTQNWILNSANHRVKNEKNKQRSKIFWTYSDLFVFCMSPCYDII